MQCTQSVYDNCSIKYVSIMLAILRIDSQITITKNFQYIKIELSLSLWSRTRGIVLIKGAGGGVCCYLAYIHLLQFVLSSFATVRASQGVQELAPSGLMLFPSQDKQNVPFTGR